MRILLAILLLASLTGWAHADPSPAEAEAFKRRVLSKESSEQWKQIHWASSVDAALADAQKSGRPLLVFLVTGDGARPNAARC